MAETTRTRLLVHLTEDHGCLHLTVGEDGVGFDVATTGRGSGLTGIADRLDTVGGNVEVESTPGSGTIIWGTVPVPLLATRAGPRPPPPRRPRSRARPGSPPA